MSSAGAMRLTASCCFPQRGRQISDVAEVDDAGDMHQRIDAVGQLLLGERPRQSPRLREVADDDGCPGKVVRDLLGTPCIPSHRHDGVATVQQPAGENRPDAGTRTGDQVRGHVQLASAAGSATSIGTIGQSFQRRSSP